MKTNAATWKQYLDSWPEGQWFDDSDETYDGVSGADIDLSSVPNDAEVVFTCGVVYESERDQAGVSLTSHFKKWLRSQSHASLVVSVPHDRRDEFVALLSSVGGKLV
jgi:hypothetical protein